MQTAETKEIVSGKTPQDTIRFAIEKGANLDQIEKLLTLQERWEANEAKKAYHKAVSDFKKIPVKVTKDKKNSQYKSMYTTLGNLVNTINPELSKHGLSASWEIKQNGTIEVVCILTHSMGHSERTSAHAPADTSGSKNAIQQIKSTITYLKAVTFESICGLASTDANYDDDGAGSIETINEKELHQLRDMILETQTNEAVFLKYLEIDRLENLPKSKFKVAVAGLEAKAKQNKKGGVGK